MWLLNWAYILQLLNIYWIFLPKTVEGTAEDPNYERILQIAIAHKGYIFYNKIYTLAWMNSSTRPVVNRPRSRGPWPCFDMHSKVRTSSSLLKKISTPSPYNLTRTFLRESPFLVGQFIWKTSLVIAPFKGITCKASMSSVTSPKSEATEAKTSIISSGEAQSFSNSTVFMAIVGGMWREARKTEEIGTERVNH